MTGKVYEMPGSEVESEEGGGDKESERNFICKKIIEFICNHCELLFKEM